MSNALCNTRLADVLTLPDMTEQDGERPIDRALRMADERLGMGPSAFGEELGVSPQVVTNWKRRGVPPLYHAQIAELLGCTIEELLGKPLHTGLSWPFQNVPLARVQRLSRGDLLQLEGVMTDKLDEMEALRKKVRPPKRMTR